MDLSDQPVAALFAQYRAVLGELKRLGAVRTENAPAGDYAEFLVARAFHGRLASNSEKSWDVLSASDERLQVKCRVVSDPIRSGQTQLSPFRSFEFDQAVIVLLSDVDYTVRRATRIPAAVVEEASKYREWVNGYVVHARDDLLGHAEAEDVTEALGRAQRES